MAEIAKAVAVRKKKTQQAGEDAAEALAGVLLAAKHAEAAIVAKVRQEAESIAYQLGAVALGEENAVRKAAEDAAEEARRLEQEAVAATAAADAAASACQGPDKLPHEPPVTP